MDRPLFITTIPKAGTYFMAALLRELGLRDLRRHVYPDCYHDYGQAFYKDGGRGIPKEIKRPIEAFAEDAGPGGFAVGHLHCGDRERAALSGCRVVYLVRELRSAIVSSMRFEAYTGRDTRAWTRVEDPRERLLGYLEHHDIVLYRARHTADWRWHANLTLDFAELRRPAVVERLIGWLGAPRGDAAAAIEAARGQDTLTRVPPDERGYWSGPAEDWFVRHGGPALNEALGYDDDAARAAIRRAEG
ncbi:MAG: hypothetical protein RIE32_09770 [Phycisphaerales bacterium]